MSKKKVTYNTLLPYGFGLLKGFTPKIRNKLERYLVTGRQ